MEKKIKSNHFKGYQDQKVGKRTVLIQEYLSKLIKQKMKFRNITELAENTAEYLTKLEGNPCNKSTLLRNEDYKALLNNYLYTHGGIKDTTNYKKNNPIALLSAELTSSNAERENFRLKQYIASLEKELDSLKNNKVSEKMELTSHYMNKETKDISLIYKAMTQLIQHFDGLIAIDSNTGSLIDLSKKRNNIIVDNETFKPFFEWNNKNTV